MGAARVSGKPNPLVPNFNNPTSGLKPPKAKPIPRKTAPKKGPYSKPVKYKTNTHYAANTPVIVGGKTILTKGPVNTGSRASKPAPAKSLDRPAPKTLKGQQKAAATKKAYQSQPSLAEQVSGLPANTLGLMPLVHRIAGGLMGSGPGNDAVIVPGEGSLVDQVAEHLTNGVKVGRVGSSLEEARQIARDSMNQGKNKSRVIFQKGSAEPLQSVVGDVVGPKSRSGILPHLQTAVDKATQRAVDKGNLGSFVAKKNVANLVKTRQHFIDQLERSTGETLKSNNLKDEQRVALWMVAEDHAPSTAKAFFQHEIASTTSARVKHDLTNMSQLFEDASKYVKEDARGNITLHGNAPRAMHQTWGWMQKADAARVAQGTKIGAINTETAAARLSAPGRVMQGARVNPETGHLAGAEDFTGGKVFVTSRQNERLTGIGRARVSDIVTNRFRKAVGLTGEYHGTNLLTGRQDVNAPKLVGQGALSMQRFFHKTEGLQNLQEIAKSTEFLPEDLKNLTAVKMGDLSHSEKIDLNEALAAAKAEKMPSRKAMQAANKAFGHLLDGFLKPAEMQHLLSTQRHYGFVWTPLVGDRAAYAPITNLEHYMLDVPSGALKTLIVYTKLPGHIPARRFSNGFFNLAQMGPRLLPIAIKQLILNRKYPDWATAMQMLTGEGSLESIASTKLQHTLTNVVRKYSDANPRRMAVYYELEQVAGRSLNPDEAVALLKQMSEASPNSKLGHEFVNLTQRASVHAGDYSRLSPVEKRFVSKVLFLWTWHRTAAVTLSKFALEHPLSAAAVGAGTYYLNERVNAKSIICAVVSPRISCAFVMSVRDSRPSSSLS